MKVFVAVLLLSLSSLFSFSKADEVPVTHIFPAETLRVVDGDTMDVLIDLGLGMFLRDRIRILDFDAAETWRPRNLAEREHGEEATKRAIELLDEPFFVRIERRDNFGRVLVDILLPDGRMFNAVMVEEGFEKRPYY